MYLVALTDTKMLEQLGLVNLLVSYLFIDLAISHFHLLFGYQEMPVNQDKMLLKGNS